ncbi:hypothetical protein K470DRAFT_218087 [Piedraia hortae CBS 480.64]|uniref:Carboxymuconolactone decarboxylase-like domain-containing protein n=1 Tax=Piedraia hortae CBS 480.64 TaxID=1314780 RepID=A0A6A7BY56_9PEZI|nr:hypothetical protein K470DRAFT_218087 [Piedraia hortae CBS 480.64]
MRIPYAPESATDSKYEAVYERIRARRAPRPLIPLDRAMLHNPEIADGYNALLGAIRTRSSFPQGLAELAICRIAVLNRATYEWTSHSPLALKAGISRDSLEAVLYGNIHGGPLSEEEKLVLKYAEQSTKQISVDEDVVEELKKRFSDQQVMELAITVASYNMVSRFLVALDVGECNDKKMTMPE